MRLKGPCGRVFRGPAVVGSRRGSFFADQQSWDPAGRVCCAVCLAAGPRPPPIGLACELKGSRARDAFTETEVGLGWLVAYVDRLFARG